MMQAKQEKQAKLRFGPAGMPLACKGKPLSSGIEYTAKIGLNAFEVEFVRGVRLKKEEAPKAKSAAEKNDVLLSCHAPYWINCCSKEKSKQQIAIRNLLQTARAASLLDASIIVFHPGYYQGQNSETALRTATEVLQTTLEKMKEEKLNVLLGPETTGKKSQFGSIDEILELCKKLKKCRPTIDFAHIHARTNGSLRREEDYEEIITKIKRELKTKALEQLHCHFTEVEYNEKGEKWHLNIGTKNSPPFLPLAKILKEKKLKFTIISESPFLDKDALKMLNIMKKV